MFPKKWFWKDFWILSCKCTFIINHRPWNANLFWSFRATRRHTSNFSTWDLMVLMLWVFVIGYGHASTRINHNGAVSCILNYPHELVWIGGKETLSWMKPSNTPSQIWKFLQNDMLIWNMSQHMARIVGSFRLFSARVIPHFTLPESRRIWRRDLNVFVRCIAEMLPQTPMWYHMSNKQLAEVVYGGYTTNAVVQHEYSNYKNPL